MTRSRREQHGPSATATSAYRGRFAPSPTGPLHLGSLVAAVGSRLQALAHSGSWLVRIEDLDPPREVRGASSAILRTLERFGLHWDGEVAYQSTRAAHYDRALATLAAAGHTFGCSCTRRELAIRARRAPAGTLYPGTCRDGPLHPERPLALRVRVPDAELGFVDRAFGACRANLATRHGDFVVRRADGLYAYHLAVVVDDAEQGITEVVRGADLLEQTLPQLLLQRLLGLPVPGYLHLPLAVDGAGHKLSKQTGALPLPAGDPRPALLAVLQHLGQAPPAGLRAESLDGLWHWAVRHWDPAALPTAPAPLRAPSAPAR